MISDTQGTPSENWTRKRTTTRSRASLFEILLILIEEVRRSFENPKCGNKRRDITKQVRIAFTERMVSGTITAATR